MLKNLLIGTAICLGMVGFTQPVKAQEKTKDELKTEREALKTELKSAKYQESIKKLEELKYPGDVGASSLDGLSKNSKTMLDEELQINKLLPEMYKRTVGESVDGVTDVTVKKPTMAEVVELSTRIATQAAAVAAASSAVAGASKDVTSASPMQAGKYKKSLNYSKDVIGVLGPQLDLQGRIVKNLIATMKSEGNL